jgi:hypothetical protein
VVATVDGWRDVAVSPDGTRVAVQRIVPDANDIWTIDLARGVPSRFTFSLMSMTIRSGHRMEPRSRSRLSKMEYGYLSAARKRR